MAAMVGDFGWEDADDDGSMDFDEFVECMEGMSYLTLVPPNSILQLFQLVPPTASLALRPDQERPNPVLFSPIPHLLQACQQASDSRACFGQSSSARHSIETG